MKYIVKCTIVGVPEHLGIQDSSSRTPHILCLNTKSFERLECHFRTLVAVPSGIVPPVPNEQDCILHEAVHTITNEIPGNLEFIFRLLVIINYGFKAGAN